MNRIAVLGLGKIGHLVASMLNELNFEVIGVDKYPPKKAQFKLIEGEFTDEVLIESIFKKVEAVVCCTPYYMNKKLAEIAVKTKTHYFDLTEDVETTQYIQSLAKSSDTLLAPQCGLAPGLIGIIGSHLTQGFDRLDSMKLRVGALPRHPIGKLGYAFNWSPEGLINEYIQPCEVIENGQRLKVPALQYKEDIVLNQKQLEAFSTSGGLGTLCQTLEGKINTLNYKSIRYQGHRDAMNFLLNELNLKTKRAELTELLYQTNPPMPEDLVYIHAEVRGWTKDRLHAKQHVRCYDPKEIVDEERTSIAWTTAASVCAVVELVQAKTVRTKGFLKQEEIGLDDFLATQSGGMFHTSALKEIEIEV